MTLYVPSANQTANQDWANGLQGWGTAKIISNDGGPPTANPTLTTDNTYGIITAGIGTNLRTYFPRYNGTDGEISTTLYNLANPQESTSIVQDGVIARVYPYNDGSGKYSAVIVDRNVTFGLGFFFLAVWEFDGSTLYSTSNNVPINNPYEGGSQIVAVERTTDGTNWYNNYYVDTTSQIETGDTIIVLNCEDASFNVANATVHSSLFGAHSPSSITNPVCRIQVITATTGAVALKPEVGGLYGSLLTDGSSYVLNLKLRIVGTNAYAKVWGPGYSEPGWNNRDMAAHLDLSNLTGGVKTPLYGDWGILANHLTQPGKIRYGNVNFERLA